MPVAERREPEIGPQVGDERRRPPLPDASVGRRLVVANLVGIAVFVVVAAVEALATGPFAVAGPFTLVLIVVSLVEFALGSAAFLWAFAVAVSRSRTEAIGMGGLFFLAGSAPRSIQVWLMGAWAIQIAVAFTVASLGVFTGAAFALLAPMWGIGLAGVWGARHGSFPPRVVPGSDR
jgi:hypothetical protein